MLAAIAIAGIAAAVLSAILTPLARALARRLALHDTPGAAGHAKPELLPIPNLGGVAIFWSFALAVLAGLAAAWFAPADLPAWLADAAVHAEGARSQAGLALTMLASALVLHVLGLVDDRRPLGATPKLIIMALATLPVVVLFDVRLLELLDPYVGGSWLSVLLTVLWFLAVINAMNFMDNMDGLSAGTAAVAASCFLVAAIRAEQWFVSAALAVLLGALLGFLLFNFPFRGRASIFMGDGGSLVVGYILAFLTVRTTYVHDPTAGDLSAWYGVFMPLCVLAVPLYDLVAVSTVRISQGTSPLVGDQQHLSHRLRARGLTVRQTLAVVYGLTAISGIAGILLASAEGWIALLAPAQTLLVLIVLAVLEYGSARRRVVS